jgi:tetratricopeptide (TPR) repeat protein
MKIKFTFLPCLLLAALGNLSAASLSDADALFQQGRFSEAEKAYALADDPKNAAAEQRLGEIALLSNRFADAEKHLRTAIELSSEPKKAQSLLGQVFFRQDNFVEAAKWYRAAGNETKAAELESYRGVAPYRIEGAGRETILKLTAVDPLPAVQVRVNGGEPVEFLIDTGGAEVVLEKSYAKQLALDSVDSTTGTFAGGKQAEMAHSRASFTLGDFLIKDVPVAILPLPQLAGTNIRGIIGTELLYHFLATLDYPAGQLILRRKSPEALRRIAARAKASQRIVIPFWMAGDHYMVARGTINQHPPVLLFVDTGFSMGGFLCPTSTLKEAGINTEIPDEEKSSGERAEVKTAADQADARKPPVNIRFVVDRLSLGDARAEKIKGLTGVFPPSLENAFGFRIAGLVSHQFFRPYAVTLDFTQMQIFLEKQ